MKVPISGVRRDPTLQLRENGLDMERIGDMVEAIKDGVVLPPVTVVGGDNLLADGFHRVYSYERAGESTVEATRVEGGYDDALAIAIRANSNGAKQLTRSERNAAIKRLLRAGWTNERIAKETGLHQSTISDIRNPMVMKGEVAKTTHATGRPPKPVAVLPERSPARTLNDTTLVRIADAVPVEQQVEFAEAVAEAGLSEPRTREAIKAMKEQGMSPSDAVASRTPGTFRLPIFPADVARELRKRIEGFVSQPWSHKGQDVTLSEAITIASAVPGDLAVSELADVLDEVGRDFIEYAIQLRLGATPVRALSEAKVVSS